MNQEILAIIDQIQSDWSLDMVIRFLYRELAPCFQRDLLYFLSSEEEKMMQYQAGFINRFPKICCSTLADFYVNLFQELGISAKKIIATSSKIPLFAILVEGEKGWYFLDPLSDLFSNQFGLKPYFFGVIPRYKTTKMNHPELVEISQEYISSLDTKLNLDPYLDDFFQKFHLELANRNRAYEYFQVERGNHVDLIEKKLELYNEKFINLGNVPGIYERALLYRYLNDRLLNHSEKRDVCVHICDAFEHPYIAYEIVKNEETIFYKEENENGQYILKRIQ